MASYQPLLQLFFRLGVLMFMMGLFIDFAPPGDYGAWFALTGILCAMGLLLRSRFSQAVALALLCLGVFASITGFLHGIEYQQQFSTKSTILERAARLIPGSAHESGKQ